MKTTVDRIANAYRDVVDVEQVAPGLSRVTTWSDAWIVDARGDGCNCPDKQHNLSRSLSCKHEVSAEAADRDDLPSPWDADSSVMDAQTDNRVMADGGVQ